MNVTGWLRGLKGLADTAVESFPGSLNGAPLQTAGLLVSDVLPAPQAAPAVRNARSALSIAATDSGRSG